MIRYAAVKKYLELLLLRVSSPLSLDRVTEV